MSSLNHPAAGIVTVVGVGANGWPSVPPHAQEAIVNAEVLVGGQRHLDMVPAQPGQRRMPWPRPLRDGLADFVADCESDSVVALASGDPLVSGVGSTLIAVLGADRVRVVPGVSSVALARAEMGWSAESCAVVSVVGRATSLVLRELAPGRRLIVLSADESTPAEVAGLLTDAGYGASTMHVLSDLGSSDFARVDGVAHTWSAQAPRLNLIALSLDGPLHAGWSAGLPDNAFEHDGQITKRDLRASALARLMPAPGQHLWDVGAGAGSVAIEWMRAHPTCTATAIEAHPERADRITRNAGRLGVPGLDVVHASAPEALAGLRPPDAVFVGGGLTGVGVIAACLSALPPEGRLVAHAVTLESERLLLDLHTQHGGDLTRISVESAEPIGSFSGWKPARGVTQWALTRGG